MRSPVLNKQRFCLNMIYGNEILSNVTLSRPKVAAAIRRHVEKDHASVVRQHRLFNSMNGVVKRNLIEDHLHRTFNDIQAILHKIGDSYDRK